MSGSSKFWVGDRMYLVDDEVYEYFEQLLAENERLAKVIQYFESCLPDEISDTYNSPVDARCPACGYKTMQVVRPGKYQCSLCNGVGLKGGK